MKKLLIAAVIVLAWGLGAAIYFCVTLNQDKNALTAELNSTKNVLATTQAELASTNGTLVNVQAELNNTKDRLVSTMVELSTTQVILTSTQSELESTNQTLISKVAELSTANDKIASIQDDLNTLQDSLSGSQQQLAMDEATLKGLGITVAASKECKDVELINNPQAHNPTWDELMSFLATDNTEQHEYIPNVYDCSQFSRDVHNNAEAAGIRAAEVQLKFDNMTEGHAVDAFITTDYGLVYIDCTSPPDAVARIERDKAYRALNVYLVAGQNARNDAWWDSLISYYYVPSSIGGEAVVASIKIYW